MPLRLIAAAAFLIIEFKIEEYYLGFTSVVFIAVAEC